MISVMIVKLDDFGGWRGQRSGVLGARKLAEDILVRAGREMAVDVVNIMEHPFGDEVRGQRHCCVRAGARVGRRGQQSARGGREVQPDFAPSRDQ